MLTNTQTQPTQALAVPEPAPPQRALSPAESWQGLMLDQKLHYATILADSTIIPDDYRKRPANILIACSKGAALGLSPEDSLYAIHVIKGRPSLSAEAMRARVQAMGHKLTIESSVTSATVTLERTDGHPGGSKTYTTEMAHQAGLDKPSKTGVPSKWTLDPEPMCIARASSRVLKAHAADLVSGITFAEDVIDEPMIEIGGGSPVEALQATTEAVAAIEAPAPEPVKKASKPAEPPQAAASPRTPRSSPTSPPRPPSTAPTTTATRSAPTNGAHSSKSAASTSATSPTPPKNSGSSPASATPSSACLSPSRAPASSKPSRPATAPRSHERTAIAGGSSANTS
jgi:hypothetical protein